MTGGEIPQSAALAEASLDSLSEAINRFDARIGAGAGALAEPGARRDLDQIIAANRAMREKWEALEKTSGGKAPRAAGAATKTPLGRRIAGKTLEDLGL